MAKRSAAYVGMYDGKKRSSRWSGCLKAARSRGLEISCDDVHADSGAEGGGDRPVLRKLLECLGEYDTLFVPRLAVLGEQIDLAMVVFEAVRQGVEIISVKEGPLRDSAGGESLLAAATLAVDVERSRREHHKASAARRRLEQGRLACRGIPRYGYAYDRDAGQRVIEPEAARVVRLIFEWASAGESLRWIADRLTAEGLTTSRGNAWSRPTLKNIISDPIYTGDFGTPRLVDDQTWGDANRKIRERATDDQGGAVRYPEYWLRGHLRCADCNDSRAMTLISKKNGKTDRRYHYVRCERCHRNAHNWAKLEPQVWGLVERNLRPPLVILEACRSGAKTGEDPEGLRQSIRGLESKLGRCLERWADEEDPLIRRHLDEIVARTRQELQDSRERHQASSSAARSYEVLAERLAEARKLAEGHSPGPEQKKAVVHGLEIIVQISRHGDLEAHISIEGHTIGLA